MKIKKSLKHRNIQRNPHTRTQKGGVPEEAKIGRTITRIEFFTCALGAPMTDSPLDAVSAAEPLCTHGKDKPGLGPPNSLKLLLLLLPPLPVITTEGGGAENEEELRTRRS